MQKNIDIEDNCAICFLLIAEPVKLPCNHFFCLECIFKLQQNDSRCPICRQSIPIDFEYSVDEELQSLISKNYPETFQNQLKLSQEKTKKIKNQIPIIIEYGNTHQFKDTNQKNTHKWQLKVNVLPENHNAKLFIEKVKFKNHESFAQVDCEMKYPFKSKFYLGWGTFNIPIKIQWKSWIQKEPTELEHYLSFEDDGMFQKFKIFVDKDKFANQKNKFKL